jgi:hypothetical protein
MFPSSMLAKLFVKGSLKNTETGFELKLKNIIDSGTLIGMGPVVVDEATYPPAACSIKVSDKEISGEQLSHTTPMPVRAFAEITLRVQAERLQPGEHKLTLQVFTNEAGKLQFSVTEPLTE